METLIDIQKLLKQFGIFVYIGNRQSDIIMMEHEIRELYENGLISIEEYQRALLVLNAEKNNN
ncbi:YqgQ family protein [Alkalibacillus sp. S2W]|uniref:YqgQ family protein n=1 Tax=Alkalibacillus sp. S2W TaxID=3386553 RepID=UPI00398CA979